MATTKLAGFFLALLAFSVSGLALDVAVSVNSPAVVYAGEIVKIELRIFNTGSESISGDIAVQVEDISNQANLKFVDLLPSAEQRTVVELVLDDAALPRDYKIEARIISANESVSQEQDILVTLPPLRVDVAFLKKVFEISEDNAAVVTLTNRANSTIYDINCDMKLSEKLEYIDTGFSTDELEGGKSLEKTLKFDSKSTANGATQAGVDVVFRYEGETRTLRIIRKLEIRTKGDVLNVIIILLIVAAALLVTKERSKEAKAMKDVSALMKDMKS